MCHAVFPRHAGRKRRSTEEGRANTDSITRRRAERGPVVLWGDAGVGATSVPCRKSRCSGWGKEGQVPWRHQVSSGRAVGLAEPSQWGTSPGLCGSAAPQPGPPGDPDALCLSQTAPCTPAWMMWRRSRRSSSVAQSRMSRYRAPILVFLTFGGWDCPRTRTRPQAGALGAIAFFTFLPFNAPLYSVWQQLPGRGDGCQSP